MAQLWRRLLVGVFAVGCGEAASVETGLEAGAGAAEALARAPKSLTVQVHYPAGFGHRITLHCGGTGLDWSTPIAATWTAQDVWVAKVKAGADAQCKPRFDDQRWALGPNSSLSKSGPTDLWPFFFHATGSIAQRPAWHSTVLGDDRRIWVYLPPSYEENPAERYPVVYLQDGQNLFYDEASFAGVSWNVGGAMDEGALDGTVHEAIVIGIDSDANRVDELTPVADPDSGGGQAAAYLKLVVSELKPQLDQELRTLPDAAHTVVGGSSLGGLFSLYAGLSRPDVFGAVLALSPSTWWDGEWITAQTRAATGSLPARVYLDSGDRGASQDDLTQTTTLAAVWQTKPGVSVRHVTQAGASHSEVYWRQRIPGALAFGLGPR